MLLSCDNLEKSFGDDVIFKGLSLKVENKDKIAIVGPNGCGKSTFLKVICGQLESDGGKVNIYPNTRLGYLEQKRIELDSDNTLSGGEATKARLDDLFEEKPSILLLDEPTNHLDLDTIEWLENKLKSFKGALLIVSHDRYFLDKCSDYVLDMGGEIPKLYKGNYSKYYEQKQIDLISQKRAYDNQQREIAHQKAVIKKLRQFNRQKSIKRADSRQKALNKVELIEAPTDITNEMNLYLEPNVTSGNDVLLASGISKSFGERTLFKDVALDIQRGEHVALIGANGTGKTTLLKIIHGDLEQDSGDYKTGTNVSIGYYDQAQQNFNEEKSLFDEIHDDFPYLTDTKVRSTLAAFGFYNEDVFKRIEALSGGERGRLSLAKLMLSEANFLLLDEPTNHLDMESKEILEDAITRYTGTVLYVSHDRYFVNQTAERVLDLSENSIRSYLGGYEDYIQKKNELIQKGIIKPSLSENATTEDKKVKEDSEAKLSWEERKQAKANESKRLRDIEKTKVAIEGHENRIEEIDEKFNDPDIMTDGVKLRELSEEKELLEDELMDLYQKLEDLEG